MNAFTRVGIGWLQRTYGGLVLIATSPQRVIENSIEERPLKVQNVLSVKNANTKVT